MWFFIFVMVFRYFDATTLPKAIFLHFRQVRFFRGLHFLRRNCTRQGMKTAWDPLSGTRASGISGSQLGDFFFFLFFFSGAALAGFMGDVTGLFIFGRSRVVLLAASKNLGT